MRIFVGIQLRWQMMLLSTMILSSCSFLAPVKLEPETSYILNTTPYPIKARQNRPVTLFVSPPETIPAYNTTKMAYTINPYQIAYFTKNRWAETPSQMLQPLIVQTLQNTGYFHAIVVPPFAGNYHYVLSSQVLQLQQNFTYHRPLLQFTLRVQLSSIATGQVIATKQFSVSEPILQKTPYGGVIAANHAAEKILRQLAAFCLSHFH